MMRTLSALLAFVGLVLLAVHAAINLWIVTR